MTNKLQYWCITKVNSTGHDVIVNSVLLSSLIFFASIWGGTKDGIKKVTSSIGNYMSSGALYRARTKVVWLQCCQPKDKDGITMVNP